MHGDALNLVSLAEELESYILNLIPGSELVTKYGGTLFTLRPTEKEAQFCGVFIYKSHVQISFSKGAHISDPNNLLSGSGKLRRHLNFKTIDDVDERDLQRLLIQASKM